MIRYQQSANEVSKVLSSRESHQHYISTVEPDTSTNRQRSTRFRKQSDAPRPNAQSPQYF